MALTRSFATWNRPPLYPECVLGMDVPEALVATSMVLDPEANELRFYRLRV